MKSAFKITLCVLSGAVFCTAAYYGFLFSLPLLIDLNKYKESAAISIEKETGFKVSCEDISFQKTLTPHLKLHLDRTLILYPDNDIFVELKETDLSVKILPLMFKKIEIHDVRFTRPVINLTLYKDFSTSVERYINPEKKINTNGFQFIFSNAEILCSGYQIKMHDESIGKLFYLEGERLILKDLVPSEQARVITKGYISHNKKKYIDYDIDLILHSDKKQFTFSPFKRIYDSDINGEISAHIKLEKNNNINGSLKINNLKLNTGGIILDNNNINLVFKGQKVLISSILHTSKEDIAVLDGEYTYGRNKYLNLETKARNIKLENLHKIISEISEVLNMSNALKDIKMTGLLNADFTVKSDFKTLASNGHAKIKNAMLQYKLPAQSLTNINAEINFDGNKISTENAQAFINKTPVFITGGINKNVEYDIKVKSEDFDLAEFIKLFNLENKLPFKISKGNFSLETNLKGILNKTCLGSILINNFSAVINKENIKAETLKLLLDGHKITIPVNTLSKPVPLEFSGEIECFNKKQPAGIINIKGKIPSSSLSLILNKYVKIKNKPSGYIDTSGIITFSGEQAHIQSRLKADGKNYISFAVIKELLDKNSFINLDCIIQKNNMIIKDLSLCEDISGNTLSFDKPKKIINISGETENINDIKNASFKNLKISVPKSISSASNFAGGEEFTFKTDIMLNNNISSPVISGNIKINKLNIKKYLTSIKNADMDFQNGKIKITAPDVTVNNSLFNITADILPPYNMKNITISDLMAHCSNLDMNTLFSVFKQKSLLNGKINVKRGSLTVNNMRILNLKADEASADIVLSDNIIKLSDIAARAYGGSIEGTVIYNLQDKYLKLSLKGSDIDIKTSLFDLCKLEDNLAGRMNFKSDFSLITGEYVQALKSLKGSLNFTAKNGKMGTLGKFEYYLYAQNILYHGLLNTTLNRIAELIKHDNTAQYVEAKGNMVFKDGYMTLEDLTTTGINMSLYISGRHNMLSNLVNMDIYGRISDEVKSKLGNFADYSISSFFSIPQNKKEVFVLAVPNEVINKIPELYGQSKAETNTFKVNICGSAENPGSINSFIWIMPDNAQAPEQGKQENNDKSNEFLPSFSDLTNETI